MSFQSNTYSGQQEDVEITDMVLNYSGGSVDLVDAAFFVALNIYEDVFANLMTGNVQVLDGGGFFEKFRIQGDETLSVRFKTNRNFPGPYFQKEFVVFASDAMATDNGSPARMYQLQLATPVFYSNQEKRMRRSYKEKQEHLIVQNIAQKVLGLDVEVEPTRYARTIVMPGWKPLFAINKMAETSVRATGYPASNYLFFEDKDKFRFMSIDKMIEADPSLVLEHNLIRTSDRRDIAKIWNAKDFRVVNTFDSLRHSRDGTFAHKFIAQDIIRKKVKEFEYDYRKEFGAQVKVDAGGAKLREKFSSSMEQSVFFGPWQKGYNSEKADEWALRRRSMMKQFDGYAIEATTSGNTNATVGKNVRFDLGTASPDEDALDTRLSGNYLITRIAHSVTLREHNMNVEIRKNALFS